MSDSTMAGSQRGSPDTGTNKGTKADTGSNDPIMRVAPITGASSQNAPVAEPLTPFEMNQMVQKIGSVVYSLNNIVGELHRSLSNPSVNDDQKAKIIGVMDMLKPLAVKTFRAGMKLNDVFLPSNKKLKSGKP